MLQLFSVRHPTTNDYPSLLPYCRWFLNIISSSNTTIKISDVERVNVQRLGVGKTVFFVS